MKTTTFLSTIMLHMLLVAIMNEIKFGTGLTRKMRAAKAIFKDLAGLKANTPNVVVFMELARVYNENNRTEEFNTIVLNYTKSIK